MATRPALRVMSSPSRPDHRSLMHLRPRNLPAALYTGVAIAFTVIALIAAHGSWLFWLLGQVLLAAVFQTWWVLLHEAGHGTLFGTRRCNRVVGRLAGFLAGIPFTCWRLIHRRHHVWTGWQDLDATTESLVPRDLGRGERALVDVCWRLWIPLFAVAYRFGNFWNLPRLWRLFPSPACRRQVAISVAVSTLLYAALIWLVGPLDLFLICGPGLLLGLALQDPLILSQHTHVPMHVSKGQRVEPFAPLDQEEFTRSLAFPSVLGRGLLMNLGAHELHHMYPYVPGYDLHRIPYRPLNLVDGIRWIWRAKRVPAHVFLFQNRTTSGIEV